MVVDDLDSPANMNIGGISQSTISHGYNQPKSETSPPTQDNIVDFYPSDKMQNNEGPTINIDDFEVIPPRAFSPRENLKN